MTVTLRNTTRSDLGIGSGLTVPARGEVRVTLAQWKAAQSSRVVQGWLNAGKIIPSQVLEFRDPAPAEDAPTEPQSAPQAAETDAGAEDTPEALFARAVALGLSPSPRWKPDTLRRKIAEAENS